MNPTYWEENDGSKTKVSFLNCRSIKNKFEHVKADMWLLQSDVIVLTETWLGKDDKDEFQLPNYNANLNNRGRGKGIASYYNNKFEHRKNINCNGFSITKIEAEDFVIIGVYKSKEGNARELIEELEDLIDIEKVCVIGGDFNVCLLKQPHNYVTEKLNEMGFEQIVRKATHIEGGLIDHVYIKQGETVQYLWDLEEFPKYYSDHDGFGITLWQEHKP